MSIRASIRAATTKELDKRAATEQRQFDKSCRQTGGGTGMKEPSQVSNLKLAPLSCDKAPAGVRFALGVLVLP
jgi:hypothetical protein